MESGCGQCCQDCSCGAGGRLLRVAWTLALDAPWSWQPAAPRTHDQLYNCCCWAVGQLSFNKIKYCFYSGLSVGNNENRVDTILWPITKKYAHGCREKKGKSVVTDSLHAAIFVHQLIGCCAILHPLLCNLWRNTTSAAANLFRATSCKNLAQQKVCFL